MSRELLRKALPLESYGVVNRRGNCKVVRVPSPSQVKEANVLQYGVQFDKTGDTAIVDELALEPLAAHPNETLLSRLTTPDPHALWKVQSREAFLSALFALHRETQGLESLAASRIELYPHQAFVAATVITDPVRRFMLADEVGLGKTIEAGIVVHDMLADRPNARVLVLTPGTLCRQWLCELHMSFGGQGFRLADLHSAGSVKIDEWPRLICSIERATLLHARALGKVQWDMVVVDEAHRLLWAPDAYSIVSHLSANAGSLLLLSAVPARERADELLRLLQLIDKKRYASGSTTAKRFTELYNAQPQIGRRLRILDRELAAVKAGEAGPADIGSAVERLVASPVVSDDRELTESVIGFGDLSSDAALAKAAMIRERVIGGYRLSRRIIKNRRAQLVARSLLAAVPRQYEIIYYEPDAFESDCWSALRQVLAALSKAQASASVRNVFARLALYAMVEPAFAFQVASALVSGASVSVDEAEIRLLDAGFTYSQEFQEDVTEVVGSLAKPHVPPVAASMWMRTAQDWVAGSANPPRFVALLRVIKECIAKSQKVLVFCGVPGGVDLLVQFLRQQCGQDTVESFTYELDDARKEENVRRFRSKSKCLVLVSDESGGEGRNFQFADIIVHYDLPWSVAAVEQRVGRLDRIGRTAAVKSIVICNSDSVERDYVAALAEGFKVFTQSISGLEFMLREQEQLLVTAAQSGQIEDLETVINSIAAAADNERRSDDAEALTDAASFRTGNSLLSVKEISPDLEQRIEDGFVRYFRALAKPGSARQITDDIDPNLRLWLLKPDEVRNERLPGLQEAEGGIVAEHRGTCQRKVARERRGIEFFSVGNALFDSVASVALERLTGRVFGVAIQSNDHPSGTYLYVRARIVPSEEPLASSVALCRRSRVVFFGRRASAIYALGQESPLASQPLEDLVARALAGEIKVRDVGAEELLKLIEASRADWGDYLVRMQSRWSSELRKRTEERHGDAIRAAIDNITLEKAELKRSYLDATNEALNNLDRLETTIRNWQPVVDVIGVVLVSP